MLLISGEDKTWESHSPQGRVAGEDSDWLLQALLGLYVHINRSFQTTFVVKLWLFAFYCNK